MQPSDTLSATGADFDASRLLAPTSLDAFFADYWQKAALYVPKRSPDVFAGLYSCQDIELLLNLHHFQPARLQVLRSQDVSCGHSVALSPEGLVDLPKLYAEFNEGATLLVYNLHELSPAVARCCRALEQVLQSPVEVTAVCTSRARDSSAPHYDPHDVFVVHLEGRKHWRIYDPFVTWPLRRHPVRYEDQVKKIALGEPLLELTVGPGDLLYVPRGLVHAIEVEEAPALHLSLAVAPLTWTDLLSALLTTGSAEHTPLREALPRNFLDGSSSEDDTRAQLRRLLGWLAEQADLDAATHQLAARFLERLRPLSDNRLWQCEAVDSLNLNTRLSKCAGVTCHLEVDSDSVTLRVPGHAMRGPLAIVPALNFISNADVFAVNELPRLTDEARLTLARRLVKEGILQIAR